MFAGKKSAQIREILISESAWEEMTYLFAPSLTGGFIGDYLGRRKAFRINLLIVGISACAATFVPNMYWLIFFRCLMGIGMGALIMVGYASFTEFIPPAVRGKWSARLSFVGNWSPMLSAAVGVVVIAWLSWRVMFLLGGATMLLAWYLSGKYFIESPRWLAGKGQRSEAEKHLVLVESQIETEKNITLPSCQSHCLVVHSGVESGSFWLLFKGPMLRCTLVAITVLIAMNISLYTITVWIPTIFVNSGIDVTKSIFMTAIIMIGAPVGIFIAAMIIDRFPRRLFGSFLLVIIALLGYFYSIQTEEWAILSYGLVMIFFLYMYVCFASAVYVPELWPTHLRLRGSGFVNAVGRIVAVFTPYGVAILLTRYGSTTVFIVLGVMLVLCALILLCFGIETRKVSLEEISTLA
ncbi:Inner membrane metabolite transport protein ydjE [Citrobacter werkmanii]|uniref:Inner membrane metabolite transport protein ydjE n=1 Tax=Citrobacter werkmanii TaxID=67827 RepID=A0ABM8MZ93_9ENTR|nr:Inner membrane metabolite transport protein ydjE [Citrobacter werkmanii]CAB5585459.1 Inner membrane metabolite transport protein ydjE [Citrobacter werkmanii]CAB5586497.1 Inner membrane metabolite transport protein ydjE [Citrobacter werkmanii]CAB5590094.1 Inner membrane metabolite transport protein ydjE [Citrobacter werkmanii]CAB5591335.1 Inner membrane metabolite transport protein ydjE [Citrobacter werkmanii]